MDKRKDVDREFLDARDQAERLRRLAREAEVNDASNSTVPGAETRKRLARIARRLDDATGDYDDPVSVYSVLRDFDSLPESDRRRILNGWRPVTRRPRSADVLPFVAENLPLKRVLCLMLGSEHAVGCQDYDFCDDEESVRITIVEGTSKEEVERALRCFATLVDRDWKGLIDDDPSWSYSDRRGEIWRAYDFQRREVGLLVTYTNELNRPIAFIDGTGTGGLGGKRARQIAEEIAAEPAMAANGNCIDLRAYGRDNSEEPTPGWLYGLLVEPVDVDLDFAEMRSPRPHCRFMRVRMREQDPSLPRFSSPDLYEYPLKNGGSPIAPTAPQPASKTSGKAKATAAR